MLDVSVHCDITAYKHVMELLNQEESRGERLQEKKGLQGKHKKFDHVLTTPTD